MRVKLSRCDGNLVKLGDTLPGNLYEIAVWPTEKYIGIVVFRVNDQLISPDGHSWWTITDAMLNNQKNMLLRKFSRGESVTVTQE